MEWTAAVEADLQDFANLATLGPVQGQPSVAASPPPVETHAAGGNTGGTALEQRGQLAELTLNAYEQWALSYPGAADALERSLQGVDAVAQRNLVEVMPDDWVDDETLPLLYGQEPVEPWRPPVIQVEEFLAWSLPALKATVRGWLSKWPRTAPLLT